MNERDVERSLRKKVEQMGGLCLKWVSPGNDGVPDRIILLPDGRIFFVELKSDTGTVHPLQKLWNRRLTYLGFDARILKGKQAVDEFIREIEGS